MAMLNAVVKRAVLVLSSFLNVSVEAEVFDTEKLSRTTLGKPFHIRGALLEKAWATVKTVKQTYKSSDIEYRRV